LVHRRRHSLCQSIVRSLGSRRDSGFVRELSQPLGVLVCTGKKSVRFNPEIVERVAGLEGGHRRISGCGPLCPGLGQARRNRQTVFTLNSLRDYANPLNQFFVATGLILLRGTVGKENRVSSCQFRLTESVTSEPTYSTAFSLV